MAVNPDDVVALRREGGWSLTYLGVRFGVTKMRVQQILREHMPEYMTKNDPGVANADEARMVHATGAEVGGSRIVRRLIGDRVEFRCPCGATFERSGQYLRSAVWDKRSVRCGKCGANP